MNNPGTIPEALPAAVSPGVPLWRFILGNTFPKQYLACAVGAGFIQFTVFKLLYPYADFFSDSYNYLFGAYANLDINIWPIGYSKFLRAFHNLSTSDTALVACQYVLFECGALYLFFSLWYLYNIGRTSRLILFAFLFANPLHLYICNYINSDALFAALSLLWFTTLLWLLRSPRPYQMIIHALLLFFCFTVRNNAYYYPIAAIIVFIMSSQSVWRKVAGIALPIAMITVFVIHSRNEAGNLTGRKQFSLFTGWQLANNALYFYEKVSVDSSLLPTERTKDLDRFTQAFFAHNPPEDDYRQYLQDYVGNFFIRQPRSPLKRYMQAHYNPQDELEGIEAWGKCSAVFADYGNWIIRRHPVAFVRYFMLLNVRNYFLPPLEKLEIYNLGEDSVGSIAAYWFHYRSRQVYCSSKTAQASVLHYLPGIFLVLNLYFAGALAMFLVKRAYRSQPRHGNLSILTGSVLIAANFGFCVFATIIVLRYQEFPMILLLVMTILLMETLSPPGKGTSGVRNGRAKFINPLPSK